MEGLLEVVQREVFLIDVMTKNNEAEMVSDSCALHVKSILQRLGPPTDKLRHLGRGAGTKKLNTDEIGDASVRRMGQWNQSVHNKSHSSKLPMDALRSLAGFGANGFHFNTRTTVMPAPELTCLTSIRKWAPSVLRELEECKEECPTAIMSLQWFMS